MRKLILPSIVALVLSATPATATDLTLFGSYWDTAKAGNTAGGGLSLGLPFNDLLGLELRATYFEQLNDHPFENAFDNDNEVFRNRGINVTPLEVGLRFSLAPGSAPFRPYASVGAGYFLLDSDFGEVKDEVGFYGVFGFVFGDDRGPAFVLEANYRKVKGSVEIDPQTLEDIDDIDLQSHADLDLDGFGANAGVRFTF